MARKPRQGKRSDAARHEGFLRHAHFRWLKLAIALCLAAIAAYVLVDVQPRPRGGSWYGYLLGTIGAALIVWLTVLGVRKRLITPGNWSLKGWVSAHVYLGLSLLVIVTLHTGFKLGWNVHSLAYGLMVLVILSGIYGVWVYSALPRQLSENRGETTQRQMLESIRSLDGQLHEAAQPLDQATAALVRMSIEKTRIGGGLWRRLTSSYRDCATRKASLRLARLRREKAAGPAGALDQIAALLERKSAILAQARRHMRIRARLEVWLYIHVPATFALLAALTAHIVSVFFYW